MALVIQDNAATYTKYFTTVFGYPIATNLVALYDFGTSAGGKANFIPAGTQPTQVGTVAQGAYSVTVTGSSGYFETGINTQPAMSLVAVVTHDPSVTGWVIGNYQEASSASLFCNGSDFYVGSRTSAPSNASTASGGGYSGSAPTFLCGVCDGTNQWIYSGRANTLVSATGASARTGTSTSPMRIGREVSGGTNWNGPVQIHMIAVHSGTALSATEVATVYQKLRTTYANRGITNL